jgi:N-methylhydantoinase A/oxoprolinase/acetone carboxylase beta subunit
MAAAIRIYMAEKGADPSRFTLVAFGGGGPVHAFALAKRLGTARVLIPPSAGIASAFGLLVSPISFDLVRTHRCALNELDLEHLASMFAAMEAEGKAFVARAETAGEVTFLKSLDICYVGQTYSVNVSLPAGDEALSKPLIRTLFEKVYEVQYGRVYQDMDAQLMNLRLVAQSAAPKLNEGETARPVGRSSHALKGTRLAYSGEQGKYVEHAVYDRYRLASGVAFRGPAIIEERESTTVVDHGGRVSVDDNGALVISLERGEA